MKQPTEDSLLACLCYIADDYQLQYSKNALTAGLPLSGGLLSIKSFMHSAARLSIDTQVKDIELKHLSQINSPTLLLLSNNKACIVHKIIDENVIQVIYPEESRQPNTMSLEDLSKNYMGLSILLDPVCKLDKPIAKAFKPGEESWFWGTLLKFKQIYSQILVAALLINCFALALPLFVMNVYDRVIPNEAMGTLWVFATGIIIILAFDFLFRMLRSYLIDITGKKADTLLTSTMFQQLLGLDIKNKPDSSGAFANHIRGLDTVRDFFTSASITIFIDIPFILFFIAIIAFIAGSLAMIPLIAIVLVIAISLLAERPMRNSIARVNVASAQKHAMLVESLTQLESIKALTAEGKMQEKWERFSNISSSDGIKAHAYSTSAIHLTAFIQQATTVAVIIMGVYLISAGNLSLGGLIACTILTGRAIAPLGQIISLLTRFQQTRLALKHLNEFMNKPQERKDKNFFYPQTYAGKFELKDVVFSYKADEKNIINSINFTINPGDKYAILGATGSGKTTLQKLLLGFYQPTSGQILFDDINLQHIDPAELRSIIGYVPQQTALFYGSLRENLLLGCNKVSDAELKTLIDVVGLQTMVQQHPQGFDRLVGEQGQGLSGGQCQAIMIARALLRKPKILFMDEPTSAMDMSSEKKLLDNLQKYCKDLTLIIITHKHSILQLVDNIVILEQGRLKANDTKTVVLEQLSSKPQPLATKPESQRATES